MDDLLKTKKEYKNLKKQETYIYMNELGKGCFQHDVAHGDFKGLSKKKASDKVRVKRLTLLKIQNMMDIKEVLLQWFLSFLIKSPLLLMHTDLSYSHRNRSNSNSDYKKGLATNELYKPIIKNLKI